MAEDAWSKKRKRSEDSSSDESSQYSSACESHQGSEGPTEKTTDVFDISLDAEPKPASLTGSPKKVKSTDSASGSGLGKRKGLRDSAKGVKRRLWDVDAEQVDIDLDRELKRMHKEVTLEKSAKWNFDFEREAPLSGNWSWCSTETAPHFYKTKDVTSKFKPAQPPTLTTYRIEPRVPTVPPATGGNLIRPKAIRPTVSTPTGIRITLSNTTDSTNSSQKVVVTDADTVSVATALSVAASESISPFTRLAATNITALADTSAVQTCADSESGTISSSSTGSCSVRAETKRRRPMTLRPRKRKRLQKGKT